MLLDIIRGLFIIYACVVFLFCMKLLFSRFLSYVFFCLFSRQILKNPKASKSFRIAISSVLCLVLALGAVPVTMAYTPSTEDERIISRMTQDIRKAIDAGQSAGVAIARSWRKFRAEWSWVRVRYIMSRLRAQTNEYIQLKKGE
jgi:hypothetical protein